MKARREARSRATGPIRTNASPQSFFSNSPSPTNVPVSPGENTTPPPVDREDTGEDLDGTLDSAVSHPMPRSLDNGATLDWSGKEVTEEPKHERKWSLAINKRKGKDKVMSAASLDNSSLGISRHSDYDGSFHHHNKCSFLRPISRTRDQTTNQTETAGATESLPNRRTRSTPLLVPICVTISSLTPSQSIIYCPMECRAGPYRMYSLTCSGLRVIQTFPEI